MELVKRKMIKKILDNLRPNLVFEYFSKRNSGVSPFNSLNGWTIKVYSNGKELLGEYYNGELIEGEWFEKQEQERSIKKMRMEFKEEAKKKEIKYNLYLNKLLCQGKQNGGISWNEYDCLLEV